MAERQSELHGRGRTVASMDATKRSILRYLERYEREWGHKVWIRSWQMSGCTPPEEHPDMAVVLGTGRVRQALGQMVREGLLEMRRDHGAGHRHYSITEAGRERAIAQERIDDGVFA